MRSREPVLETFNHRIGEQTREKREVRSGKDSLRSGEL